MTLVPDLDLPVFDYAAPGLSALRSRATAFPGLGGVERIYGINQLPIIWPGPTCRKT